MDQINETTALFLAVIGIVGGIASWVAWLRPLLKSRRLARAEREHDRVAQRDVLLGRPAMLDSITNEVRVPELPGVGKRLNTLEAIVGELAKSNHRHEAHEAHLARHDDQIAALEAGSVERVVSKAESAAAWRAMEAATLATPDQVADEAPDLS